MVLATGQKCLWVAQHKKGKELRFCFGESGTAAEASCVEKVALDGVGGEEDRDCFGRLCVERAEIFKTRRSPDRAVVVEMLNSACFSRFLVSFKTVQPQCPGFFTFVASRPKQGSLRTAVTSSSCDVKIPFSRMSRRIGRDVSSIAARVWYILVTIERKEGAAVK